MKRNNRRKNSHSNHHDQCSITFRHPQFAYTQHSKQERRSSFLQFNTSSIKSAHSEFNIIQKKEDVVTDTESGMVHHKIEHLTFQDELKKNQYEFTFSPKIKVICRHFVDKMRRVCTVSHDKEIYKKLQEVSNNIVQKSQRKPNVQLIWFFIYSSFLVYFFIFLTLFFAFGYDIFSRKNIFLTNGLGICIFLIKFISNTKFYKQNCKQSKEQQENISKSQIVSFLLILLCFLTIILIMLKQSILLSFFGLIASILLITKIEDILLTILAKLLIIFRLFNSLWLGFMKIFLRNFIFIHLFSTVLSRIVNNNPQTNWVIAKYENKIDLDSNIEIYISSFYEIVSALMTFGLSIPQATSFLEIFMMMSLKCCTFILSLWNTLFIFNIFILPFIESSQKQINRKNNQQVYLSKLEYQIKNKSVGAINIASFQKKIFNTINFYKKVD